jgi:hypothetical protein
MWKRILPGIALAALLPFGVQAQTVTKTPLVQGAWIEISVCPVHLSAIGHAWYAMTASSSVGPSLVYEGHPIPLNGLDVNCANTGYVWARTLSIADQAVAYSSPITAGGSGGGGGGAVTLASGAVAAGAYSAGAFVSGSFLSGALADGAITTLGTEADVAWVSGNATLIALGKATVNAINGPVSANVGSTTTPLNAKTVGGTTGLAVGLNDVGGTAIVLGQAPAASSIPVVLPSGTNVPVAGTVTNNPAAATIGGALNYHHYSVATASGDTQFVKASPGNVYSITVTQSTTTAMELKLYNLTSAPTCSSATGIVDNIPIPSNVTSPGYHLTFPVGRVFSTGIAYCITAFGAPAADTDSGTPAVGVTLSMTYD